MAPRALAALALTLACAGARPPQASAPAPRAALLAFDDPARLTKLAAAAAAREPALQALFEKAKVPGLLLGLVADGKLVYWKGLGVRELASAAPVDADTVFRIASMSKAFVAAAVLHLRDEGKLSLDDAAEKYLPELASLAYPTKDSPKITVRQLLSHAAGFPEDNASADLRMPMSEAAFDELLSHGLSFSTAPGTRFEYANLGFALLGRLIGRVSGERAQDYIARNLLTPLSMTSSGWDGAAVPESNKAHGYGRKGSNMPAAGLTRHRDDEAFHEEPLLADGAWAPLGGLWTSPRDYAKWVAFQLSAWPPRDDADAGPVRRSSLREAQEPQRAGGLFAGRDDKGALRAGAWSYGFGWGVTADCRFAHVVTHGGGLPGYGSWVMMLPDRGVAAFTMANLTYTSVAGAARELLEALDAQGLIPERPRRLSPQLEAARAAVLALLGRFDPQEYAAAFDKLYATYEPPEALEQRLATLRARHGACRPAARFEPEDALRGVGQLDCERGAIELGLTLTSDAPPRIQSLALESMLPPPPKLRALAGKAVALLQQWDDGEAAQLYAADADRLAARGKLQALALDHGACAQGEPTLGDGATSATFRLACEHGDLDLKLELDAASGRAAKADFSAAHGGPRCAAR